MNILQRMYRDVQEPVLNAMGGPNPFQDLRGANNTPAPVPSTETSEPAPNPWASTPRTTAGVFTHFRIMIKNTSGINRINKYDYSSNIWRRCSIRSCLRTGWGNVYFTGHAISDGSNER